MRLRGALVILSVLLLGGTLLVSAPAVAAGIGTGAVSVKGPGSELVPGTTIEIRKDTCTGSPVWLTTTTSRPDAYGAFGIGLAPGDYCVVTLAAPAPYERAANVSFTMEQRPGNWVTVWLPGPPPVVTGAVVAKDSTGAGINGVTAFISQGPCGSAGAGVWRNTTATSQWSTGGFGISLPAGDYCTTTEGVPEGYQGPTPTTVTVTAPSPTWITIWLTEIPITGSGAASIYVDFMSDTRIVEFSCPDCTGETEVWAWDQAQSWDMLVSAVGSYPIGRFAVGILDLEPVRYRQIEVTANAPWTLKIMDVSRARQVWSSATGTGDDVVAFNAPGTSATLSHHGAGYFGVASFSRSGYLELLVETEGDYWGRVPARAPSLVQVYSAGSWQIDVE